MLAKSLVIKTLGINVGLNFLKGPTQTLKVPSYLQFNLFWNLSKEN